MGRPKRDGPTERHRHFTDEVARRLPVPENGSAFYWDSRQPGLGLRVWASHRRVYIVEVRFRRESDRSSRSRRETLGTIEDWPIERARERAADIRGEYKRGVDRRIEFKKTQVVAVTLGKALAEFLSFKADKHKPRTQDDMRKAFDAAFPDWLDRPLTAITEDMVLKRHQERTQRALRTQTKRHLQGSGARADLEMRYLRAVFRWARKNYRAEDVPVLPEPPTGRISEMARWNNPQPKQRTLEPETMPAWYAAVMSRDDTPTRDWLLFTWLTGLRSAEGRELRWAEIDLDRGAFVLLDPKNRHRAELPITPAIRPILEGCRTKWKSRDWVFPGATEGRPLGENTGAVREVVQRFGRRWSPHDCRAAFQTAGTQCRIHPFMIRVLLNHKLPKSDAHARYFRPTLAEKAASADAIQRHLLRAAGVGLPEPMDRRARLAGGRLVPQVAVRAREA